MRHDNRRARKRPRATSSGEDAAAPTRRRSGSRGQAPAAQDAPLGPSQGTAAPRAIPGFVWDAEKRRYFPAKSRAASGQQQRHEQREQRRIDDIAAAQQRQPSPRQQQRSVSSLLRCRATSQPAGAAPWAASRRVDNDQLAFACMGRSGRPIDYSNAHSIVTALCVFGAGAGQQYMAVGHRSGSLALMELDASDGVGRSVDLPASGEIAAVNHIEGRRFLFASMGAGQAGGALTVASWDRLPMAMYSFSDTSVFAASRPAVGRPFRTCVGTSAGVSVLDLAADAVRPVFNVRSHGDIVSTTFAHGPHVGFGGGRDGRIRLFDMRVDGARHDPGRGLFSGAGCRHASSVHGLGAEGWLLASASMDGRVCVWDVRMATGKKGPLAVCASGLENSSAVPAACRLGFDVRRGAVAAAGSDNQVRIWSLRSGHLLQCLPLAAAEGSCTALVLSHPEAGPPALYLGQSGTVHAFRHAV
ncbi:DDB1- and CUL4-associated factor 4 [Coemansia biformis]|uniref:DDB1- and CUL4-associated factor 4 n=1 Tax=Coemansia biformis TaxID=1286918 RepID=A0A9W7YB98_9FUNG|nr:DDB1- and CUL4-associated factor 4 [Coemansia biformis]